METVAPGYNRPRQVAPLSTEQEAAVNQCCPGSVVAPWWDAPLRDPLWGPAHRVMVGYSTDEEVRYQGSSGGVITALALHALGTGLVDRVLNVVADADWPTRNGIQITAARGDVIAGAGSRYAPSSPLEMIGRMLEEPGRLAFIGKPCDVSALRQFAKVEPRVNEIIPLMLAFFCAGVPSTRGADKVIRSMGLAPDDVRSFRYRGEGWPGSAKAVTGDGRTATMSYADSWGGHLSKEVQFRCKICPDAVGGVADVACADAWYGGETGYPTFEEMDGRSLIITRTGRGETLLSSAMAAGAIEAEPLDKDEIILMQPSQVRRKRMMRARRAACHVTGRTPPVVEGLDVAEAAAQAPLRQHLKEFLGTLRRIVREKPPVQTPAAGDMA